MMSTKFYFNSNFISNEHKVVIYAAFLCKLVFSFSFFWYMNNSKKSVKTVYHRIIINKHELHNLKF